MKQVILIDEKDDVVIALLDTKAGTELTMPDGSKLTAVTDVPRSHKIAIHDIKKGDHIYRYGEPIGYATADIKKGEWVHVHNLDAVNDM